MANGAEYHGDLTKAVTHLIAAVPSGKKYEYARMWQVTVVSLEWFQESVERGMVLEEELYDPVLPPEQRGKDAWKRELEEAVALGKRARDVEHAAAVGDSNRRKLRRTASTKLGSQSQSIWADMASFGPSKSDPVHGAPSGGDLSPHPKSKAQPAIGTATQPLDPRPNADAGKLMSVTGNTPAIGHSGNRGIFGGRVVCIVGFDSKQVSAPLDVRHKTNTQEYRRLYFKRTSLPMKPKLYSTSETWICTRLMSWRKAFLSYPIIFHETSGLHDRK